MRLVGPLVEDDVGHDDDDGDELQPDTPAHQLLAQVRARAAHHVPEAEQEHDDDRRYGNCREMVKDCLHRLRLRKLALDLRVSGRRGQTTTAARWCAMRLCGAGKGTPRHAICALVTA